MRIQIYIVSHGAHTLGQRFHHAYGMMQIFSSGKIYKRNMNW